MKKYDYYRPAGRRTSRHKQIRKNVFFSLLKLILLLCLLLAFCWAGYWGVKRAYEGWTASRLGTWKPKTVSLSGAEGNLVKELNKAASPYLSKPFSVSDSVHLRQTLLAKYPQLRHVRVKRGLFTGTLKITVKLRSAIAQVGQLAPLPRLLDADGTVYTDPNPSPLSTLPILEIEGENQLHLPMEWVQFIQYAWKNKNQLSFEKMVFYEDTNSVKMYLSGNRAIDFGTITDSKEKLRRAMQILSKQPAEQDHYTLDFKYFDEGKVFLRQKAR